MMSDRIILNLNDSEGITARIRYLWTKSTLTFAKSLIPLDFVRIFTLREKEEVV